jgi:hypothetical protein
MNKLTQSELRMQMLAGVITEGEYAAAINQEVENTEKDSLNEHMIGGIVGIGAINQIPPRVKTDYEDAFEHFLGERYEIKPNRERDDIKDVNEEKEVEEGIGEEDKIQQWVDMNAGGYGPDEDDENFPEFKKEMKDLLDNSLTTMNLEDFIEDAIDIIEKYTINYYGDDTSFSPDDIKDDFYEFVK